MRRLFWIGFLFLIFTSCNKTEESDWTYCNDCNVEAWIGTYHGDGTYYAGNNPNVTTDVSIDFSIRELYNQKWKIVVSSENIFIITFIGDMVDTGYYYEQAGSSKSIHLTLYEKDGNYKISGSAKTYDATEDSVILVKSVSFDVFKQE